MEKSNILSYVKNILEEQGILVGALPLSECTVNRAYLLDRCGIDKNSGTAIMLAIPYLVSDIARLENRNVSLYAVAKDYHLFVRGLSDTLLPCLCNDFPSYKFHIFADHSPIDERDAAVRAGLGVKGLNGMLITPQYGSFVFIADIITDAPIKCTEYIPRAADLPTCNRCGACVAACPVACKADECLSALTQKKGELTQDEQNKLRSHDLVWGCDTCQLACPINQEVVAARRDTDIEFFKNALMPCLDESIISSMSDEEFSKRAYSWRTRQTLIRNIRLQIGNGKEKLCSN